MIDKQILIQLGWSDDLIAEVTRTAKGLNAQHPVLPTVSSPVAEMAVTSSNSIYYDSDQVDTSDQLITK
jgi:hypothetical protein